MEEDQKNVTISVRFSDFVEVPKLKRMNKQDRLDFIDWMFEHLKEMEEKVSLRTMAKKLSDLYRDEHHMLLNPDWVNNLLRAEICKLSDGTYNFERKDIPYSIEQVCERPTLFKNIKW